MSVTIALGAALMDVTMMARRDATLRRHLLNATARSVTDRAGDPVATRSE
jgi:hypothetical protein